MYSFTSRVRYSECDENLQLSTPAVLNYLQDCSMFHCEEIGHGLAYCADHGFAWFVLTWQIRIDRRPAYCERIRINTWCYEMTSTLAKRAFVIEDEDGNAVVTADSLVVAFSTSLGRAARIPQSEFEFVGNESRPDLPPTKRKVRLTGEGESLFEVPVTERLIDTNDHVNNVQYVDIAEQAIRLREKDFTTGTLHVQYRVAAHLGDTIVASLHTEDEGYGIDLTDPEGNSFAVVRVKRTDANSQETKESR